MNFIPTFEVELQVSSSNLETVEKTIRETDSF